MKKSVIALLLCVVALAFVMVGCQTPGDGTPTPAPTPTGTVEEELEIVMKAGDVYKIYFVNTTVENLWVDGVTGVRAQENRQRWLDFQQEYGVTITWIANSYSINEWPSQVPAAAAAGEPICDIYNMGGPCFIPLSINAGGLSPASYYVDFNEYIEYTNFKDNRYWDQSATEAVGYYGGKLHVVVPQEIGIGAAALNMVTYFNKDLLAAGGHSASEIYDLYNKGEWTFDAFRQMCIDCTDLDKNVYGVTNTRNYLSVYALIYSNGGAVLTNNEQGCPEFTADSPQALKAVNFFIQLAKEDGVVLGEGGYWQEEAPFFRDGQSTFMVTYANRAWEGENQGGAIYQNENIQYGIVLNPKGPDATDYASSRDWYTPFSAFKGHDNMAGVVQCLSLYNGPQYAADSAEAVMLLESQASLYFQDNESIKILKDAIEKNITVSYMAYWDLGTNGVGHLTTLPMDSWLKGESTPEHDYAAKKDALNIFLAEKLGY